MSKGPKRTIGCVECCCQASLLAVRMFFVTANQNAKMFVSLTTEIVMEIACESSAYRPYQVGLLAIRVPASFLIFIKSVRRRRQATITFLCAARWIADNVLHAFDAHTSTYLERQSVVSGKYFPFYQFDTMGHDSPSTPFTFSGRMSAVV